MGLFGNDQTVMTTFKGKDSMSPVVRGIRNSMANFKRDAIKGFGLQAGFNSFNLLARGVGAVTDAIGDSIKAASDMAETQSKLDVVFKENAGTMRSWASDAAQSMGMTKQAALEAAGTFGNFLQAMGTVPATAAEMSRAMVTLASDLASFNNASPEDVLLALRSGLSGEVEPMRKFGVDLSAAAVDLELMRQGIAKVGKEFRQEDKIQARYNILMRQTSSAQGDFMRTADGLANSQRIQTAVVADAKAELGKYMIEVDKLVTRSLTDLIRSLGNVGDAFNNLNRFIHPDIAAIQNVDAEIRRLADGMNINAEAIIAWMAEGRQATALLEADRIARETWLAGMGAATASEEERAALLVIWNRMQAEATDRTKEATDATATNATVTTTAQEAIRRYLLTVGRAAQQHERLTSGIDETKGAIAEMAPTAEQLAAEMKRLADATAKVETEWKAGLGALAGITKTSMKDARIEARAGAAQFAWALKHPLADDKLADFYERQVRTAGRRARRAQRAHNEQAYAEAVTQLERWKTLLSGMEQAKLVIRSDWKAPGFKPNFGKIEKMATGTPYVPRDMIAMVHKGEAIIPAAQNRGGNIRNVIYLDGRVIYDNVNRRMGRDIALNGSV